MGFQLLEKVKTSGFRSSGVDYPAIVINTGRSNSAINSVFVRQLGLKPGDSLKFDLMHDPEKKRFAIRVGREGATWEKLVTKSCLVDLWLGPFLVGHKIWLKGQVARKPKGETKTRITGERIICKLKQSTKNPDMWIFSIPEEFYADGPPTSVPVLDKPKERDRGERKTSAK